MLLYHKGGICSHRTPKGDLSDDAYLISCLKDTIVPIVKCQEKETKICKKVNAAFGLVAWLGVLILFLFCSGVATGSCSALLG